MDLRIDGDMLVYRAGFAADSRGTDLSHSLYNVKLTINSIMNKFGADECTILLTSKDPAVNFRTEISTYKANRKKQCLPCENMEIGYTISEHGIIQSDSGFNKRMFVCNTCGHLIPDNKPIHYNEIRQYLVNKFNAKIVEWGEADDWLCTNTTSDTIIVSNDKDLLMAPATHYRLCSDQLISSSDPGELMLSVDRRKLLGTGFKWFCAQMLLGDTVDNIIKPKAKMGPSAVYKLLNPINDIESLWACIKKFYKKEKKNQELLINADLLWMARKPRQRFSEALVRELHESTISQGQRPQLPKTSSQETPR